MHFHESSVLYFDFILNEICYYVTSWQLWITGSVNGLVSSDLGWGLVGVDISWYKWDLCHALLIHCSSGLSTQNIGNTEKFPLEFDLDVKAGTEYLNMLFTHPNIWMWSENICCMKPPDLKVDGNLGPGCYMLAMWKCNLMWCMCYASSNKWSYVCYKSRFASCINL